MYVDQQTWVQTILFIFTPFICVFIYSFIMLVDLPWNDDDADDDALGGGLMTPVFAPSAT